MVVCLLGLGWFVSVPVSVVGFFILCGVLSSCRVVQCDSVLVINMNFKFVLLECVDFF